MATKTQTKEPKAEVKTFNLERAAVLWIYFNKEKTGKYLSGRTEAGEKLTGFFNSKDRKNPKEPDIRISYKKYLQAGKTGSEAEYCSLWCNATKNGRKYLSGKVDGKKVVGFFNSRAEVDGVIPYINLYYSDTQEATEQQKAEFEEIPNNSDLPL